MAAGPAMLLAPGWRAPLARRTPRDYPHSTMASPVVQNLDGAGVDTSMRQAVLGLGVTLAALVGLAASHAPVWLAGARLLAFYPFGPTIGAAANITLTIGADLLR